MEAAGKVNLTLGGFVSLLAGALLSGRGALEWSYVAPGFFIILFFLLTCGNALRAAVRQRDQAWDEVDRQRVEFEKQQVLQEIRHTVTAVVERYEPHPATSVCILIVESSRAHALPPGTSVFVCFETDTHEVPLGPGTVRPPESNGKMVITLDSSFKQSEPFIRKLREKADLDKVKIVTAVSLQLGLQTTAALAAPAGPGPPSEGG